MRYNLAVRGSGLAPRACCPLMGNEIFARIRNEGGGFAEILRLRSQLFLAFVISHTTSLAAQDDEMGRCPKEVFKSPVISHFAPLIPNP